MQNRINCVRCVPYGKSRYITKTETGRLKRIAAKTKRYYHKLKGIGIDPIARRRHKYKAILVNFISGGCQLCMYNRCLANIVFHHLQDKSLKVDCRLFQRTLHVVLNEARKCIVVCHNCHGEIHNGMVSVEKLNELNREVCSKLRTLEDKEWKDLS